MSHAMNWNTLLLVVGGRLPLMLVLLWAAYLCVRHAGTQRRRVVLVGIAISLFFLFSIGMVFVGPLVTSSLANSLGEVAVLVVNLIYSLPHTLAIAVLIYAVFYGEEHAYGGDVSD